MIYTRVVLNNNISAREESRKGALEFAQSLVSLTEERASEMKRAKKESDCFLDTICRASISASDH